MLDCIGTGVLLLVRFEQTSKSKNYNQNNMHAHTKVSTCKATEMSYVVMKSHDTSSEALRCSESFSGACRHAICCWGSKCLFGRYSKTLRAHPFSRGARRGAAHNGGARHNSVFGSWVSSFVDGEGGRDKSCGSPTAPTTFHAGSLKTRATK